MSLRRCIDNLKFDARMQDINLKSHILTNEDLSKHLAGLRDLQDQALTLDLDKSQANDLDDDHFSEPEN